MNERANIACGRAMAHDGNVTMISDSVDSVDCADTGAEGSAGLAGGLDVPDDGSAPTPLPASSGGGERCSLLFSVPNHVAETPQPFSVSSVAASNTGNTSTTSCLAGQSKVVNFTCAYVNPGSGTLPLRMGDNVALAGGSAAPCSAGGANLTLNFNAGGVASATVMYADAGQMTLLASYAGCAKGANCQVSGASTFIVAPARFAFGAIRQSGAAGVINPAAASDQGAPFIAAGAAFSSTLSALNQLGNPVPNFGQEAAPEQIRLSTRLVAPAGGKLVAISGNFGAFSGGMASAGNLAWGEVGIIAVSAGLANEYGYLGTSAAPSNLTPTGSSGNIGRFVPDHFDTAFSGAGTMRCPRTLVCPAAGLTYAGKPLGLTLTARNTAGSTTENYAGAFARAVTLEAWSAPGQRTLRNPPLAPAGNQLNNPAVAAAAFLQGVASTAAASSSSSPLSYTFAATYPAIANLAAPTDIYVRAVDSEGVTSSRDNAVEGGIKVVSGRFQVVNNYGSDVLALPVYVYAQFWDGARFIHSSTDQSSVFRRDDVMLNNCTKTLNSSAGCKTALAAAPATYALMNGAAHFTLAAPGSGSTGSVDLRVVAAPYLPSTTARATFGLFKGGPIVFLREMY